MKDSVLVVLKFVVGVLLLPLVIGSTVALQIQIDGFDKSLQHSLWRGLAMYLVLKLFVYDFSHVYKFGQGMVTFCFQFLKPLVNAAPFVIPVYTILMLVVYAILNAMGMMEGWKSVFFTVTAFTFAMHIILTAQDLYGKDTTPGKPNYFFGMGLVYVLDVFFIALVMSSALPGFKFVDFFKVLSGVSFDIYKSVFVQFFGVH